MMNAEMRLLRVHQRVEQGRDVGVRVGDVALDRMVHQNLQPQPIDAGGARERAETNAAARDRCARASLCRPP